MTTDTTLLHERLTDPVTPPMLARAMGEDIKYGYRAFDSGLFPVLVVGRRKHAAKAAVLAALGLDVDGKALTDETPDRQAEGFVITSVAPVTTTGSN